MVRIAPARLSFTSPDAWKDIYMHGHNSEHTALRKDPVFYAVFREKGVPLGIMQKGHIMHGCVDNFLMPSRAKL